MNKNSFSIIIIVLLSIICVFLFESILSGKYCTCNYIKPATYEPIPSYLGNKKIIIMELI